MDINVLKSKLDTISSNIPENQWKYFNRGSLYNFIYNIELIKDIPLQEKTADVILNCLKDVEANYESDIDYSVYLFNNYLKFVVPTYRGIMYQVCG
jgi:hypothetical protein